MLSANSIRSRALAERGAFFVGQSFVCSSAAIAVHGNSGVYGKQRAPYQHQISHNNAASAATCCSRRATPSVVSAPTYALPHAATPSP